MRNPLAVLPQRLRRNLPISSFDSSSPFRALTELENEMNRWMQSSLGDWPETISGYDFAPSCDLSETDKEFIVQFDIPGVKKEDVKIELENNRLSVSGERSEKKEEKKAKSFLSETFYGSFMRTLALPAQVDENKVDAHYDSGVLTIKIPKQHTSKAKEIRVQ